MVAHDQVETEPRSLDDLRVRRGPTVRGHDQPYPALAERTQRTDVHAVAVPHAVGNVHYRLAAELAQKQQQLGARRDAVDVVVAVNRDPLAVTDGSEKPLGCASHLGEQQRRAKPFGKRGIEDRCGDRRLVPPAVDQQASEQRAYSEFPLDCGDRQRIGFLKHPALRRPLHRTRRSPAACIALCAAYAAALARPRGLRSR